LIDLDAIIAQVTQAPRQQKRSPLGWYRAKQGPRQRAWFYCTGLQKNGKRKGFMLEEGYHRRPINASLDDKHVDSGWWSPVLAEDVPMSVIALFTQAGVASTPTPTPTPTIDLDAIVSEVVGMPPYVPPQRGPPPKKHPPLSRSSRDLRQQDLDVEPAYVAQQLAERVEAIGMVSHALEHGAVKEEHVPALRRNLASERQVVRGMLDQYASVFGDDAAAQVAYAAGIGPYPEWLEQEGW
jgi:hypothetical protein